MRLFSYLAFAYELCTGIYDFENKIVYKDNKYYYSGAEVLPWLNVNCAVSDNKLFVI